VINVATIGVFARTIGPKHPMASHPGASLWSNLNLRRGLRE
jgi:hypothetical protein